MTALAEVRLQSFVQRLVRLRAERRRLKAEINQTRRELVADGFNEEAVDWLAKVLGMEPADREELGAALDIYRKALDLDDE